MKARAMTDKDTLSNRTRLIMAMAALTEADGIDPHTALTAAQATVDAMTEAEVEAQLMEGEDD